MQQHLAVLGSPISHSKSPLIHGAAYRVLGLPWHYGRHECEIEELQQFLAERDESWRGLSLTMPLKEEAFRLATSHAADATTSGVVNTLIRDDDGGWIGANTDIGGLLMALEDARIDLSDTVVLGAGATAVSAILAAREGGARRMRVFARRPEAAAHLVERFNLAGFGELSAQFAHDAAPTAVISTLPGPVGEHLHLSPTLTRATLFDVAYDPWPSPLSVFWNQHGGTAVSGLQMLLFQALLQIRWFVHGDPTKPLDHESAVLQAMREAVSA